MSILFMMPPYGTTSYSTPLLSLLVALLIVLAFFLSVLVTQSKLPANYIWLVPSFIGMCILDISHAVVEVGSQFVWLHSLATCIGGILAMLVWLPVGFSSKFSPVTLGLIAFVAFTLVSIYSIIFPQWIPPMLDTTGNFTVYAKILNLAGGIGFLIAWLHFAISFFKRNRVEDFYLSNQVCFFGLAGMLFQLSVLWDGNWWLWHVLRAMAILLLAFYFLSQFYADIRKLESDNRNICQTSNSIFESMIDGLIIFNSESRVVQFSKAAEKILGYTANEIIQKKLEFKEATTPDNQNREDFYTFLKRENNSNEVLIKNKSGVFVSTDYYCSAWKSNSSSFIALIIRPNSLRKEKEAKMRLAEATMDNTQDMVFWVEPESGRIKYVNQEALNALGYSNEDFLSMRITDVDDVVSEKQWDEFQKALQQDRNRLFESVHKRKDGSTFPVGVSATLVKHDDRNYFVSLVRDISDQKKH